MKNKNLHFIHILSWNGLHMLSKNNKYYIYQRMYILSNHKKILKAVHLSRPELTVPPFPFILPSKDYLSFDLILQKILRLIYTLMYFSKPRSQGGCPPIFSIKNKNLHFGKRILKNRNLYFIYFFIVKKSTNSIISQGKKRNLISVKLNYSQLSAYDLSSYNFYFLPICFFFLRKKRRSNLPCPYSSLLGACQIFLI